MDDHVRDLEGPAEGDIGELALEEIIDAPLLRSMLDDFYRLTGMLGAVLDVSGKVLVAVGWQDICTRFHRCHPATLRNCLESDTALTRGVPVGTFKHYRCKNNMWDMVTPLEVGGRHVGNVFIGQFFYEDDPPDEAVFREQARRHGFDEDAYLAALARTPRFSRAQANAGMQFYAKLTSMISALSYGSIKLRRMLEERTKLEEQLRHAQKMEAVGRLAGGVAHDFNNILQVISGHAGLMQVDEALTAEQREDVDNILSAAEKAAQLTRGLLAFGRRQVLTFAPVDLDELIAGLERLLARTIGEDIEFVTRPSPDRLLIHGDRGQIEQVLVNLVTNARDAMPRGGRICIETALQVVEDSAERVPGQAAPGRHAVVTVSDDGCGMDAETRKKIFEPFFTTKEVGKGTGLGMAIVYGIVNQHQGTIHVYSEPGQGTTVRVSFPLHDKAPLRAREPQPELVPARGGTETVLLAEDDPDVRAFVVSLLRRQGYTVIQAVDGQDAVDKFSAAMDAIALVLLDVIMPRKNGREAFAEISRLRPGVKVLYASGYTADFIQSRGVSEEGIELVMKPVQPAVLVRKVREILDRPPGGARAGP
ncbi:MAG: PocR ligand-binding domain-containing protein [Anaeromyxobacteraceae bacterium]